MMTCVNHRWFKLLLQQFSVERKRIHCSDSSGSPRNPFQVSCQFRRKPFRIRKKRHSGIQHLGACRKLVPKMCAWGRIGTSNGRLPRDQGLGTRWGSPQRPPGRGPPFRRWGFVRVCGIWRRRGRPARRRTCLGSRAWCNLGPSQLQGWKVVLTKEILPSS